MSVTWVLYDSSGSPLTHQPSGSTLNVEYNSSGFPHLSGYSSEIIDLAEGTADQSTATVVLQADSGASGYTLSESLSEPSPNTGYTWSDSSGVVTLVFNVPNTGDPPNNWVFGGRPAIALRMKIRQKRLIA